LSRDRLLQRQRSGTITVSTSPDFAAKWLVSRLGRFAEAYPEIELKLAALMHRVDFAREDVDLAIRHGDGQWPELDAVNLCTEELFPVCSPLMTVRGGLREQATPRWRELDSNPRSPVDGELGAPGPRATRARAIVKPGTPIVRVNKLGERSAAYLERLSHGQSRPRDRDGFGYFEHLAASLFAFSATFEISGRYDLSAGSCQKADDAGIP
jgi:DNA-binding transcriptional LysR family regulator